jgi:hypothetical protein
VELISAVLVALAVAVAHLLLILLFLAVQEYLDKEMLAV